MFDLEELFRGYSARDEYVARDLLLINLLLEKGIITSEDVSKTYTPENLSKYISIVQQEIKKVTEQRIKEYQDGDI